MKRGTTPGRDTVPTSVRVTPVCKQLWDGLAEKMGLSNTGVLETAIRRLAREEGVEIAEGIKTSSAENDQISENQ